MGLYDWSVSSEQFTMHFDGTTIILFSVFKHHARQPTLSCENNLKVADLYTAMLQRFLFLSQFLAVQQPHPHFSALSLSLSAFLHKTCSKSIAIYVFEILRSYEIRLGDEVVVLLLSVHRAKAKGFLDFNSSIQMHT